MGHRPWVSTAATLRPRGLRRPSPARSAFVPSDSADSQPTPVLTVILARAPLPPGAAAPLSVRELTVKERVLLHLFDYTKFEDAYDVPPEVTQAGIARAVGIRVHHVTQYVKPLLAEEFLIERTGHVQRHARRRKTYFLTPKGRGETSA